MTKETVIIVHGTFSSPVEGVDSWYAPGSDFCRELDKRFERSGLPMRCWAHLDECGEDLRRQAGRQTPWFSWTGRNDWLDRTAAAKALGRECNYLRTHGWRCHFIAHSHGGNVLLELLALDRQWAVVGGRVV